MVSRTYVSMLKQVWFVYLIGLLAISCDRPLPFSLESEIEKELAENPFLRDEGARLRLVDVENGYVTLEFFEGNRKVRERIDQGIDIFSTQIEIQQLFEEAGESELKTATALRQLVDQIKSMEGVKQVRLTAQVNTTFDRAYDAFQEKQFEVAVRLFQTASEQGSSAAFGYLGGLYYDGLGVDRDYREAKRYWIKGARSGDVRSEFGLFNIHYYGNGEEQNFERAATWATRAAERDHVAAKWSLGTLYYKGEGVKRDLDAAQRWYYEAIEDGSLGAKNTLAWYRATSPDAYFRDAKEAVELASHCVEVERRWNYLGTLAAAYASGALFEKAVEVQREALSILLDAQSEGGGDLGLTPDALQEQIGNARDRMALYAEKQPYFHK